jgi:hypothetical protein
MQFQSGASCKREYATSDDLRKLFTEDMNNLYLLSFLLTADREEAERCFVAGLADCVDGNPVFKEWAKSWARRTIVNNAIRIVAPRSSPARLSASASCASYAAANENNSPRMPLQDGPFANVLALEDFERFVYILSILERDPDHDCAVLLGTSIQEILETRISAIQHLAEFANREPPCQPLAFHPRLTAAQQCQ